MIALSPAWRSSLRMPRAAHRRPSRIIASTGSTMERICVIIVIPSLGKRLRDSQPFCYTLGTPGCRPDLLGDIVPKPLLRFAAVLSNFIRTNYVRPRKTVSERPLCEGYGLSTAIYAAYQAGHRSAFRANDAV